MEEMSAIAAADSEEASMGPNYMGKGLGRDKLKVSTTGVVRLSHSQSSSEILQYTMVLFSTRGHRDSDCDTLSLQVALVGKKS